MATSESSEPQRTCVVCCHETDVWAVGECNHPTCLLCCARLKVLCHQDDCPVCRLSLKQVVVVLELKPYQNIAYQKWDWRLSDKRYGLLFQTRKLLNNFRVIMANRCRFCPLVPAMKSFRKLREHMIQAHDLHFCDICVENLKLFPSEFKTYTRSRLTAHRRDGDVDDTSYKGHPYCQFCDERYLDNEALHMHLRKKHFWCHFCENDGRQDFYPDIHFLRSHFKKDHYLCEEGSCSHNVLTSVFRNEIDLKAHQASTHTQGLSKAEVKQRKNLSVEFGFFSTTEDDVGTTRRRTQPTSRSGSGVGGHSKDARAAHIREKEERELAVAMSASLHGPSKKRKNPTKRSPPPPPQPPQKKVLCSQREEPEPPPGFVSLGESRTTRKATPHVAARAAGEEAVKDVDDVTEKDEPAVKTENWPSLKVLPLESETKLDTAGAAINAVPASTTLSKESGPVEPSLAPPPRYTKALHISKSHSPVSVKPPEKTGEKTLSSGPVEPSLAPPPGYAKALHSPKSQSRASKKPPEKTGERTLSSRAFPPLASAGGTSSSVPSSASGGSKVFEDIRQALDYDKTKFKDFQSQSGWFRSGVVTVQEYNTQCEELFGSRWAEVGPVIARMMPSGKKRDELLTLFTARGMVGVDSSSNGRRRSGMVKNTAPNAWAGGGTRSGTSTSTGKQGVSTTKGVATSSNVSEEDYPSLSAAAKRPQSKATPSYSNAWKVTIHS